MAARVERLTWTDIELAPVDLGGVPLRLTLGRGWGCRDGRVIRRASSML